MSAQRERCNPEARLSEDGAVVLDAVDLVMAFEEEFGMEIPDEDAERMDQIGDPRRPVGRPMDERDQLRALTIQLQRLVDKLKAPKQKDWSDRLSIISSFLSTVVVALLGLYFTQSARRTEAERQREFQEAQIAVQRAQIRIEELKALTSVAPLLASRDSAQRQVAETILDAVRASDPVERSGSPVREAAPPDRANGALVELALLDNFIRLAKDARENEARRIEALRQIERVAVAPSTPPAARQRALNAASDIAVSPGVPQDVRRTAAEVIARIQSIDRRQAGLVIAEAPLTRRVAQIVVHHSGAPFSAASYRGAETVLRIAEFQLGQAGWTRVSWHYAISPDGMVWLGMPLDERAIHAARFNATSVSILLILDGDVETPTAEQRASFGEVIRSLRRKVASSSGDAVAVVLHRDLPDPQAQHRSCPGSRITSDSVAAWIGSN